MGHLVQGWFEVRSPEPGVFTIAEPLHEERVKSYLVVGAEQAVLLDTGMGIGNISGLVDDLTDRPITVVNSHAHWDHIGGNRWFRTILIHEAEAGVLERGIDNARLRRHLAPERLLGALPPGVDVSTIAFPPTPAAALLRGGEIIDLGDRALEVIHAPGHSPGGIVLLDRSGGALFSADVAYPGRLYCQFADSDLTSYRATMARLANLAPILRAVYPAHGGSPMDPAMLPQMRDALDQVAAGRPPDAVEAGIATHDFDAFAVLVAARRPDESIS